MTFTEQLQQLEQEAQRAIAAASAADLERIEKQYLGRKGRVTLFVKSLSRLADADRPAAGRLVNEAKSRLTALVVDQRAALHAGTVARPVDVTLPGLPVRRGHLHPVTTMLHRVWDVFASMGYDLADGPEVETDEHNFVRLNMPEDHPARDMQDTFYLNPKHSLLLRTHMTAVTLGRELPKRTAPMRLLATGKCYRRDEDSTHTPMFHQFDGIVVGEGITFAMLRGTLETAMRRILERDLSVRFRTSYFPFVEPGAEFDVLFSSAGNQDRWLEMGGCGMIHPNVLRMAGHDPAKVSGFAFGFGIERPIMIKHQVPDLRLFFANDLRFTEQFS